MPVVPATASVVTATALCLAFSETRWLGVMGTALLAYLHPKLLVAVAAAGLVALVLFKLYRRRFNDAHEHGTSDPRSD